MKERKTSMEGMIVQTRSSRGISSDKFRGKGKLEIQLLLTAVVITLKKVLTKLKPISS